MSNPYGRRHTTKSCGGVITYQCCQILSASQLITTTDHSGPWGRRRTSSLLLSSLELSDTQVYAPQIRARLGRRRTTRSCRAIWTRWPTNAKPLKRETGMLLPNNQRQHRATHAPKEVLPLRICANHCAPCQPLKIERTLPGAGGVLQEVAGRAGRGGAQVLNPRI